MGVTHTYTSSSFGFCLVDPVFTSISFSVEKSYLLLMIDLNGKLAISAQIRRFCYDSSLPSFDFIRQISNKISYLIFIFDHC